MAWTWLTFPTDELISILRPRGDTQTKSSNHVCPCLIHMQFSSCVCIALSRFFSISPILPLSLFYVFLLPSVELPWHHRHQPRSSTIHPVFVLLSRYPGRLGRGEGQTVIAKVSNGRIGQALNISCPVSPPPTFAAPRQVLLHGLSHRSLSVLLSGSGCPRLGCRPPLSTKH